MSGVPVTRTLDIDGPPGSDRTAGAPLTATRHRLLSVFAIAALAAVLYSAVDADARAVRLSMPQAKRALAAYERDRFAERRHDGIIPIRWRRQSRRVIHVRARVLVDLELVRLVDEGEATTEEWPVYTTTVLTLRLYGSMDLWILDRLPGGGWEKVDAGYCAVARGSRRRVA